MDSSQTQVTLPHHLQAWKPLRWHKQQSKLWKDCARFKAVVAGRGSGKSEVMKRYIFLQAAKEVGDYFYTLPTIAQAKRVAMRHLIELSKVDDGAVVNLTDNCITLSNGSKIWVYGVEKPERAEGIQYRGGVIDECSDTAPSVFTETFIPALSHYNGWCSLIGVPKLGGIGGRFFKDIYERWKELNAAQPLLYNSYHWKSDSVLDKETLAHYKQVMSPEAYARQFEAEWTNLSASVFYSFGQDNIIGPDDELTHAIGKDKIVIVGMDFNVDPMAYVIAEYSPKDNLLVCVDEIYQRNTNTLQALNILDAKLKRLGVDVKAQTHNVIICGDASSGQRHTNASMSDYDLIRTHETFASAIIRFPRSNPPVDDRIEVTNKWLRGSVSVFRNKCSHLIDDLYGRQYKSGTKTIDDSAWGVGHITDAFGYMCCYLETVKNFNVVEKSKAATAELF